MNSNCIATAYMSTVGDTEHSAIAYCTGGRGARPIPDGTLKGVHFVKTSKYVQVTGAGNFTNINIQAGDYGGEIDNRGADGTGNPGTRTSFFKGGRHSEHNVAGGLLYSDAFGTGRQSHEWTEFISDGEFCLRACFDRDATKLCNHVYDIMGCWWVSANFSVLCCRSRSNDANRTCPPTTTLVNSRTVLAKMRTFSIMIH